ncbi:MAG TPA: lysophospholipid acyltransferase family protein [Pseudonocardiaceae bacterium]|nr:lysophospholipid acyltransferase family protein [Pseudonocardiaceae bacterium]
MAKREHSNGWVWFAALFFYPLTRLLARRVNRGVENIPATGGALLVMNHISHIDPMYDAVFVHKLRRVPRFLAKNTLWKSRVVRQVMTRTGQIPVYRASSDAQDSLRDANTALREGKLVIIYPEGTITRDPDGWPMLSRTGVARLALDNDVPVIPAARWGTLAILDFYQKKFRPLPRGVVTTSVGEPVDLAAYRGKPVTPEALREVTALVMRQVTGLLGETRGETPPVEPFRPGAARRHQQDTASGS